MPINEHTDRSTHRSRTQSEISPAYALVALRGAEWVGDLSDAEIAIIPYCFDVWLRPEQQIPTHHWRTCGLTGGRGFGKSMTISRWINARVMAGLETLVAFLGPTEDRVDIVQRDSLIEYAEPWQRPVKIGKMGLLWPNGVKAVGFSTEREGRSRSQNVSLSWCTEVVDWKPGTREEAFKNLYTATRVGEARMIWDSTAKGRNEVRTQLEEWNEMDPEQHVIIPGTMFDNPLLTTPYLRSQWTSYAGVRRDEELMGMSFREAGGALWKQAHLDATRVPTAPDLTWMCVAVDPATSTHDTSDETGILVGGCGADGHAYTTEDISGTYAPTEWGTLVVDRADPRKPGPKRGRVVIERKHLGDNAAFVVKSAAASCGLRVRVLERAEEEWPPFAPDCIYIREQNTNLSKGTRAEGPAAETENGRVHLVDPDYPTRPRFADLEKECTTYVPGVTKRSPNRLDAFAYLVIELRGLRLDSPPDHAREAAAAARMNEELQAALRRGGTTPTLVGANMANASGVVRGGRRLGL